MRFRSFVPVLVLSLWATSTAADVCVWRDPERTMARLFPDARDYRTVTYKPTADQVERIGALAGQALTPDEAREFNIYEITDGTKVIGKVLALAGPGEYGAIETVIGLDPSARIRGVYIQRIRERQRDAIQSEAFLDQFGSQTLTTLAVAEPAGAERPARVVVELVRKMLAFDHVLTKTP